MIERAESFLSAAHTALGLISRPEVAERWDEPSALPGFSVGGLAAHLGWMVVLVADGLQSDPPDVPAVTAAEHYLRAPWARANVDDDINVSIREWGEEEAEAGPDEVRRRVEQALRTAESLLPGASADRLMPTPVGLWALTLPESLLTRLVELTTHIDDLAVSVGVPSPEQPEAVIRPVLELLAWVATHRHGQLAVLRALTRSERTTGPIAAFGPDVVDG